MDIKKIKNIIIALVCVATISYSAIKIIIPSKTADTEDLIVFYDTDVTAPDSGSDAEINDNTESKNITEPDPEGRISLNKASLSDLMSLPGIGETKAKAIIEYRESFGAFRSIEEITEVKGIGEATFNKLRDMICL